MVFVLFDADFVSRLGIYCLPEDDAMVQEYLRFLKEFCVHIKLFKAGYGNSESSPRKFSLVNDGRFFPFPQGIPTTSDFRLRMSRGCFSASIEKEFKELVVFETFGGYGQYRSCNKEFDVLTLKMTSSDVKIEYSLIPIINPIVEKIINVNNSFDKKEIEAVFKNNEVYNDLVAIVNRLEFVMEKDFDVLVSFPLINSCGRKNLFPFNSVSNVIDVVELVARYKLISKWDVG